MDDLDGLGKNFNGTLEQMQSLMTAQRLLLREVVHELRSPLARMAVALELARQGAPDTLQAPLARIEREAISLNNLISRILEFSYAESIRELRNCDPLCLASLVEELLPDLRYEADARHCRIVTTTISNCTIRGDADMLRHALENIVRNAISYSPAHGTVEIEIDRSEQGRESVAVLRVMDTGPGVAGDKLGLILNPFYRVKSSRRGITAGFGVGLAIAERAVKLHNGKILAQNRQGEGLIVEMLLPLEQSADL